MTDLFQIIRSFSHRTDARELANIVIEMYYDGKTPNFPINIFKMLRDFNVYYIFQDLEGLEGMYIPDQEGLEAVVSINNNSKFERQRFTAAHELCHHLKDFDVQSVSPIGATRDPRETFANIFAAELLMPRKYFLEHIRRYEDEHGNVSPHNALYLCNIFGTSFESVMWNLNHYSKLSFKLSKEFFAGLRVSDMLLDLDINNIDDLFLRNIVDSYTYIPRAENSPMWFRLKNELIYNDSKIEGLDVEKQKVAEICTDIRLFGKDSTYYQSHGTDKNIIETVGQYLAYEKLMKSNDTPDRYQLKEYNKILFTFAPECDLAGEYRVSNNAIKGAIIETTHYTQIEIEMYNLDKDIEWHLSTFSQKKFSDIIEVAVLMHHRLTKIHPFEDGNGRISRLLLNWILKLNDLPPVYVEASSRDEYLDALRLADQGDISQLSQYFIKRVLENFIFLNSELTLEEHVLRTYDLLST